MNSLGPQMSKCPGFSVYCLRLKKWECPGLSSDCTGFTETRTRTRKHFVVLHCNVKPMSACATEYSALRTHVEIQKCSIKF